MRSAKSTGRLIGILLVVQLAGLIGPFLLLRPIATVPPEWLVNAAASSFQIKVALFLLFANCALTIGISIAAFKEFRRHSYSMALLLVAASVIMFTLQAVDNAHLMSMLSLSQRYTQAGGQDELYQLLAAAAGSTRRFIHFTELFAIDTWIFLLYCILYRYRLVPRLLAAFGLLTVLLHFTGIPLPLFLGYGSVTLMGATMALGHIALAAWLITKGLGERLSAAGEINSREANQ
jgi:hypothetical protein